MRPAAHFLAPLLKAGATPHILVNAQTGSVLATELELAVDSRDRTRGLLGRSGLAPGAVMILAPCNGIHTFFMRFAIDVVFVNKQGRVLKVCRGLKPWRIGVSLRAFAALEFAAALGMPGLAIEKGDQLRFDDK